MNYKQYKKEIESIMKDNPYEHELYSIIAELFRNIKGFVYEIRDVSSNRRTKKDINNINCYYGKSGYPDFIILERDNNKNSDVKHKDRIKGAVEIKYITEILSKENIVKQTIGHITSFRKVILTNGIEYNFYCDNINNPDIIKIGKYDNNQINWAPGIEFEKLIKKINNLFK